MESESSSELPNSIHKKFEAFEGSLTAIQDKLKPFLKMTITDIREEVEDPLQNAKLDLMVAYTTNSLFWTYLVTQGIDPKTHPIKDELLRIKMYMGKIQAVQDKKKMARIDTSAAKRFVRNALWEAPKKDNNASSKDNKKEEEEKLNTEEQEEASKPKKQKKAEKQEDSSSQKKKKKKKKKENN